MIYLGINHLFVNAVTMELNLTLSLIIWFIGGENTAVLQLGAVPLCG
jgi:hypothetical protein